MQKLFSRSLAPSAMQELSRSLEKGDLEQRGIAIHRLGEIGTSKLPEASAAVEMLEKQLHKEKTVEGRIWILGMLGDIASSPLSPAAPKAFSLLSSQLEIEREPVVRGSGMSALKQVHESNSPYAFAALRLLRKYVIADSDADIRSGIRTILGLKSPQEWRR
jgi:hypothetical protein